MPAEVEHPPGAQHGLGWLAALREPARCLTWDLRQWEHVIRLSRRLRLLGRLAHAVAQAGLLDAVPPPAARHLLAEQRYATWRCDTLLWALEDGARALAGAPYPVVLLKGSAYIVQGSAIGPGRLPSDVDLLVPRSSLDDAQARLSAAGWTEVALDAHDQRYYREWSHELPPLRHPHHGLELDLHHNILPVVARTRVDAARLIEHMRPVRGSPWHVLQPTDQVLHSAAHLFYDADHGDRVRDIVDIDGLVRQEAADPGFWPALAGRAQELGLQQPLALALHFCRQWLDTPLPPAGTVPLPRLRWHEQHLLVPLFGRVLTPSTLDDEPTLTERCSQQLLLGRHHLWRMPPAMLVAHTWNKLRRPR